MDLLNYIINFFLGQPVFDSSYLILLLSHHSTVTFWSPAGEEGEQVAGQGRGGRKEVGKPSGLFFLCSFSFFFLLVVLFMRLRRGMMMMLREARGIYVGKSSGFCFV